MRSFLVLLFCFCIFTAMFAETKVDGYKRLEKCLSEFYQGRPRDYPNRAEKKIVIFKSEVGKEYLYEKDLRGMEVVCYKMLYKKNRETN